MFCLRLLITYSVMGYGTYGSGYFNVSSITANWATANDTCFLALPPLRFDGEGIRVNDIVSDVMINDSWLGYFRYGYILGYHGCWNVKDVTKNTTTLTVADCMDYCLNKGSKSAIAVMKTSCYCISGIPQYKKTTKCDQRCPKESFTCGSTDSIHASMYLRSINTTFSDDDPDNHECLAVISGHKKWRPCSELHPLICSPWYGVVGKGDWNTYQDTCPPPSGGHDSWTNTVRSWSTLIHDHTDTSTVPGIKWIEFGYLVHRNNRMYLEFAPGSMEKHYICQFNADDKIDPTTYTGPTTQIFNEMYPNKGGIAVLTPSGWLLGGLCVAALIVSVASTACT